MKFLSAIIRFLFMQAANLHLVVVNVKNDRFIFKNKRISLIKFGSNLLRKFRTPTT